MFWAFIRWGGTLSVIAALLAAQLMAGDPELAAATASQPSKNFNLQ
jgi:glycine/D-amino acid oxidase-like deaminating enzyme